MGSCWGHILLVVRRRWGVWATLSAVCSSLWQCLTPVSPLLRPQEAVRRPQGPAGRRCARLFRV